jgi:predicted membrane channel-forming protein YqfA (hemolysin III family)
MEIKPETRESLKFLAGGICLLMAIVISFIALFLPPSGAIDSSVLWLIAQALIFVSSLWHLSDYLSLQTKRIVSKEKDPV